MRAPAAKVHVREAYFGAVGKNQWGKTGVGLRVKGRKERKGKEGDEGGGREGANN